MAKLLCVTPWPGLKTHYGRVPAGLIPLWKKHFEEVAIWSTYGGPEDGEDPTGTSRTWHEDKPLLERLTQLGDLIQSGEWSHIWILGDLGFLSDLAGLGLTQSNLPNQLLYAYAIIDTPFIDQEYAKLAAHYDFFVCLSGMATGAYVELVAGLGPQAPKDLFKGALHCKTIRPGVDNTVFYPLDSHKREFGKEELREAIFGGRVAKDDLLIMVSGHKSRRKGIPQACSLVSQLQPLIGDRRVKLYFHMDCRPTGDRPLNIPILAEGCDLNSRKDVLYADGFFRDGKPTLSDQDLNQLYNSVDLVLCPDIANGWPFTASEAMAAGTVVAAPGDHVWLDLLDRRGIELPCTEFGWAPWSRSEMARFIDPGVSAQKIAEVVNDINRYEETREAGIRWAFLDRTSSWDYSADQWLGLFGVA